MTDFKYEDLTQEQKITWLFTKCKTREAFKNWTKIFLEVDLPDCTVSRYSDTNPLDICWEIYNICVNKVNPENIEEILCVAGRGSGKCNLKSSKILTKSKVTKIEDIKVGDIVWTGWSWQPVLQTFDEGILDGITIRTNRFKKFGVSSVTGSLKHRIQAFNPETKMIEWRHMTDLKEGDLVYKSASNLYDVSVDSEDYKKGWLIGSMVGDGHVKETGNYFEIVSEDLDQLQCFKETVNNFFEVRFKDEIVSSTNSLRLVGFSKDFKEYFKSIVEGRLCYDKKLKDITAHSPNFLAGFFAGMMETDGSKEEITLANKDLIYQLGEILSTFGVYSYVTENRKPPRRSAYLNNEEATYHCLSYYKLHNYLLPLFRKRQIFIDFRNKQNEQFRYPSVLIKSFAKHIQEKYEISGGYWRIHDTEKKTRSKIPYSKKLFGESADKYEYIQKDIMESFVELARTLNEDYWVNYLKFIIDGSYETVREIEFQKGHFYDLEVKEDHAYWSNGYISHNTLGMSVVEFMVLLHDIRSIVHVGATQSQADRCYSMVQGFILNHRIVDILYPKKIPESQRVISKLTIGETAITINNKRATLEVLPCTLKALNGPHVPFIVVDEIDTVTGEGLKAFKEISGMLDTRGDQLSLRVGISTRKSQHGLMNAQIETAADCGVHLRKWTCFEFLQRCPDNMSGTKITPRMVDVFGFRTLSQEEFELLEDKDKAKFEYVEFPGEKCVKCALAPMCCGDAKNQKSTSKFLKPISDTAKKVKKEGADWALAQLMNLKPSLEGVVFKEYSDDKHLVSFNFAWELLTMQRSPIPVTKKMFINKAKSMGCRIFGGVDFGWSAPSTVTFVVQTLENHFIVVGTHGVTDTSKPNWLQALKQKYQPVYKAESYYIDTADPGDMTTASEVGLHIGNRYTKKYSREYGVGIIKKLLFSLTSPIPNLYFIQNETVEIVKEMKTFHYKIGTDGEPTEILDDANDHWIDGLRYILSDVVGGGSCEIGFSGSDDSPYTNVHYGLAEKSEPMTLRELSERQEEETVMGGGNFWFSF